jgi:hypothetical protein
MGWRIHRIWSTDWFRTPDRELVRAIKAIEAAKAFSSNIDLKLEKPTDKTAPVPNMVVERTKTSQPPADVRVKDYQLSELNIVYRGAELHDVSWSRLANWIHQVVEVESPIHIEDVTRRIIEAYGVKRIGSRIRRTMKQAVYQAKQLGYIKLSGEFLWKVGMVNLEVVRSHGRLPDYTRKIDRIAPEEIMLAVELVVERSHGMQKEEISQAVSSLLGYGRTSKDMNKQIDRLVERMISVQRLTQKGDFFFIAKGD